MTKQPVVGRRTSGTSGTSDTITITGRNGAAGKVGTVGTGGSTATARKAGTTGAARKAGTTGAARKAGTTRTTGTTGTVGKVGTMGTTGTTGCTSRRILTSQSPEGAVDPRISDVLRGRLDELPPIRSKLVRVFISSTFTDTRVERNMLIEDVYPRIKTYCKEKYGLDFQPVDMRWGVREEATGYHKESEICLKEIENCQRLSVGPNFYAFLTQKYGYRPAPRTILGTDMDLIIKVLADFPDDVNMLQNCYQLDTNQLPPVYILQPITKIVPVADQAKQWDRMHRRIQILLRKSAYALGFAKKFTKQQMSNYFISVTEREIHNGLLNVACPEEHTIVSRRTITDIEDNVSTAGISGRFMDVLHTQVDAGAKRMLRLLTDHAIPAKLSENSLKHFEIQCSRPNIIDNDFHRDYLTEFGDEFFQSMTNRIDLAMNKPDHCNGDDTFHEALRHLHMAKSCCETFNGRSRELQDIKDYITDSARNSPFIITGASGSGKTSLIGKAFSLVTGWWTEQFQTEPICAVRYISATPESSRIIPLLLHLCRQMCDNYDQPVEGIPSGDYSQLAVHFKALLTQACSEKPLVLFLDALDQFPDRDEGASLTWLPESLPEHCKIVISMRTEEQGTLASIKEMYPDPAQYLEVQEFGEGFAMNVMKSWLENEGRTLTEGQWLKVNNAFQFCSLALYVKLVFELMKHWTSYDAYEDRGLYYSVPQVIDYVFTKTEETHGEVYVSHALTYITASKDGLTEAEVEDMLSLDEEVLNDVFQFHIPPIRRVPTFLWARVKADLPYFTDTETNATNTIKWCHRQFQEAAVERYRDNEEVHSLMADYYMGKWAGGVKKPFQYGEKQIAKFGVEPKGREDRRVPLMPLFYSDGKGNTSYYNRRKLSSLPHHLTRAGRFDELYQNVLFNFRWLHAKLKSFSVQAVKQDYEDCLSYTDDNEVRLMAGTLRLSASTLTSDPDMIGSQIVGRLLPVIEGNGKIAKLIKQCDRHGVYYNALCPAYHCLTTPGGPLKFSLNEHSFTAHGIVVTSNGKYLISASTEFIIYDLETGAIRSQHQHTDIKGLILEMKMTPNNKHCIGYTDNNQIINFIVKTGDIQTVYLPKGIKDEIIGLECTDTTMSLWTRKEWMRFSMTGDILSKGTVEEPGWFVRWMGSLEGSKERYLVCTNESGLPRKLHLDVLNSDVERLYMYEALALGKDMRSIYTCCKSAESKLVRFVRMEGNKRWQQQRILGDLKARVHSMKLSPCERYLLASSQRAYYLYDTNSDDFMLELHLPDGVNSISIKNKLADVSAFTANCVIASISKHLYVWSNIDGTLLNSYEAHSERIKGIVSVGCGYDTVVTSSLDRVIRVWDFSATEDNHTLTTMGKPIERLHIASGRHCAVATTRYSAGVWDLHKGRLVSQIARSAGSKFTESVITSDAKHVCSATMMALHIWLAATGEVVSDSAQSDIQQLLLATDGRVLAVSTVDILKQAKVVCRSVPDAEMIYQFTYPIGSLFIRVLLSSDQQHIIVHSVTDNGRNNLHLHDVTSGEHVQRVPLSSPNTTNITGISLCGNDTNKLAIVDDSGGCIYDTNTKKVVSTYPKWNGAISFDGKLGLKAPKSGGLEVFDLNTGNTTHILSEPIAEGIRASIAFFTPNGQHIVHHHQRKQTLQVFRVNDGQLVANYKPSTEITTITCSPDGVSLVIGGGDGGVVVLVIADHTRAEGKKVLASLPSRVELGPREHERGGHKMSSSLKEAGLINGNQTYKSKATPRFETIAKAALYSVKARNAQKSTACSIL